MKKIAPAALTVIVSCCALVAGCGGDTGSSSTTTPTTTPTTTTVTATTTLTTTTTPPPVVPATSRTTAPPAQPATMPAVVCMNLQDAQNAIQRAGVFYSRSTDASGQGRRQVIDNNWIVVAQTPAAGDTVTEGQAVLSVVKIGEPNSCG